MLVDREIVGLMRDGVLHDAEQGRIGPVSYDLRTQAFYGDDTKYEAVVLKPGDSTFVGTRESIRLQNDLVATIALKNSRIRQGLLIVAPVYFPGLATRVFFRVTNTSTEDIALDTESDVAQIMFERIATAPDHPYVGEFSDEFEFRGLGRYKNVFEQESQRMGGGSEETEEAKRRISVVDIANAAWFLLVCFWVVSDISRIPEERSALSLAVLWLSIAAGIAIMIGIITSAIGSKGRKLAPRIASLTAFLIAVVLLSFEIGLSASRYFA